MKRKAFTIWEVLVIVAIAAIGMAILYPNVNPARENARRSSCASKLKQIGLAFLQYSNNYDDKFPPIANTNGAWSQLLEPYLRSPAIFQCPSANGNKSGATDYFFNARLAGAKNELAPDSKAVAITILSGDGAGDQDASYNLSQFPIAWQKDESSPAWRHLDGAN